MMDVGSANRDVWGAWAARFMMLFLSVDFLGILDPNLLLPHTRPPSGRRELFLAQPFDVRPPLPLVLASTGRLSQLPACSITVFF